MNYDAIKAKVVTNRFVRAFASGFIAGAVAVPAWGGSLTDIGTYLKALLLGGIVGGLMALDKYIRYQQ